MNELLKIGAKNTRGLAKPLMVEEDGMLLVPDTSAMLQRVTTPKHLNIPTYEGSNEPVHPAVVRTATPWNGYRYWMAFTPYPHGNAAHENPSIVASVDGENWVVPEGLTNPLAPNPGAGTYNRDTQLVFAPDENGGRGRMYCYWSRVGVAPIGQRSYSDDGVNWSTPEGVALDAWGIVRKGAAKWECFNKSETQDYFVKWESTDGITWEKALPYIPINFVGKIWHHSVYLDASGYHFLITCYPEGWSLDWQCLYYGFSKDGAEVVFDTTPLIIPKDGSFYSRKTYQSVLVPIEDNKFRVYFSCCGGADFNTWGIGCFDAKVSAPGAKYHLVKKPRPESVERFILKDEEIRDNVDRYINVPELSEFENKVLLVHNSLKDASGAAITVTMYIVNNMRNTFGNKEATDIILVGGTLEGAKVEFANTDYTPYLYGSEHLKALGYMLPHNCGVRTHCSAAPASGSLSIELKAWA